MRKLDFYFDIHSPFSYLLFNKLQNFLDNSAQDIEITYRPLLMFSLFSHWNITPPGIIEAKRDYLTKILFIKANELKIPLKNPIVFPFNPLNGLKLCTQEFSNHDKLGQIKLIKTVFNFIWNQEKNIEEQSTLEEIITAVELPLASLDNMNNRGLKNELKQNLQKAINHKVFGVPTLVNTSETELFSDNSLNMLWGLEDFTYFSRQLEKNIE